MFLWWCNRKSKGSESKRGQANLCVSFPPNFANTLVKNELFQLSPPKCTLHGHVEALWLRSSHPPTLAWESPTWHTKHSQTVFKPMQANIPQRQWYKMYKYNVTTRARREINKNIYKYFYKDQKNLICWYDMKWLPLMVVCVHSKTEDIKQKYIGSPTYRTPRANARHQPAKAAYKWQANNLFSSSVMCEVSMLY